MVRHALSGPLNPNGISTVSVDAYAFSAFTSHNGGVMLASIDSTVVLEAQASWYPSASPTWEFAGLGTVDFFSGAYDVPVRLEIVVDGSAGKYFQRLIYTSGVYETPHHDITPSQIATLTEVRLFEDYRGAYLGVALDNVSVTTTSSDTTGPLTSNVAVNPNPVAVNTNSALTAAVDDSTTGGSNISSAYYAVSGGVPSQMLLTPSTAITTQASASLAPFAQSNVYNICVHGTDSAGNTGADACVLLPVYDPNGSFVTGGGQVASPAGADLLNTSAAGQATFGFVSKYLPGKNTPSGNLEFQFKEGNLNFKSTDMDWLVVTGQPRAKFHGTGTVNGTNVCNFEVDAWAGSFTGNVDAFGLKISSCSTGGDRYSLPATKLTKGNIIIHN